MSSFLTAPLSLPHSTVPCYLTKVIPDSFEVFLDPLLLGLGRKWASPNATGPLKHHPPSLQIYLWFLTSAEDSENLSFQTQEMAWRCWSRWAGWGLLETLLDCLQVWGLGLWGHLHYEAWPCPSASTVPIAHQGTSLRHVLCPFPGSHSVNRQSHGHGIPKFIQGVHYYYQLLFWEHIRTGRERNGNTRTLNAWQQPEEN